MTWNWQHMDWPQFNWNAADFEGFEQDFLHKAGMLRGSMKHISDEDRETLTINLLSDEALKTSKIEGELLDRDSLQSSVRKQFGLKTDNRRVSPAEQGISEMMVDLYNTAQDALTHEQLYRWHAMIMNGRRDVHNIGAYRSHGEPMQIVSGDFLDPTIHFVAPPSETVTSEMDSFIDWFNAPPPTLGALTRAAIAHVYFESIHPFEDGNGRIGRAISEKALSQSLGRPTLIAIAHTIERKRKAYYSALQGCNQTLDINDWLDYFCTMVLEAQDYTQSLIDFLISKAKFYVRLDGQFNDRQAKAIERMFREGVDGFEGGLSADNYIKITGTTRATATRDLQGFVAMGALTRTGSRKYTRYWLNLGDGSNHSEDR